MSLHNNFYERQKEIPEKQERSVWMEINFVLEKNRGHKPIGLGGGSIVVVKQVGSEWVMQFTTVLLKFDNFNSKVCLICLNGFIALIACYQQIYGQYLKKMLL